MMKIAVASVGKDVAEHFGHCEAFALFDVDNGQIIKEGGFNLQVQHPQS